MGYKSHFSKAEVSMKTLSMADWEFRPNLVGNLIVRL
jgi:hypothetical protein